MKRFACLLLVLLLLLPAALGSAEKKEVEDISAALNTTDKFSAKLTRVLRYLSPDERPQVYYRVQQGSCTDGTYAYLVIENQMVYNCALVKLKLADWSVVDVVYDVPIDHGNDLTYNAKLDRIIAVHNKPNYTTISFIRPDTLAVESTKTLPVKLYAVAYDQTRDQYAFGISGSFDYVVTDADFNILNRYSGKNTGLVKQGMDCDERYIYFAQNSENETENYLQVYDWEGNFITAIRVNKMQEIESVFHVGTDVYISFHSGGNYTYKATFSQETAE